MDGEDLLREVSQDDIPQVLDVLEKEWPKSLIFHQLVSWMKDYKHKKVHGMEQILYRYGDITDGVYLHCSTFFYGCRTQVGITIYTSSLDATDLSKILLETTRVPLQAGTYILITQSHILPVLVQLEQSKGITFKPATFNQMWLPPECSTDYPELPADVCLRYLDDSHVPQINNNWQHKFPQSDRYISIQIENNFGLGLFSKKDNRLLCSSISYDIGGIFILYTDPEFRGRGYANLIVLNMIKELRQRGRTPFCTISADNQPSLNLFTKLGFKYIDKVCWAVIDNAI